MAVTFPPVFKNLPGPFSSPNYPPQGTGFSDGVRVGSVRSALYANGLDGILTSPYFCYHITPLAVNSQNVVASQTLLSPGLLPLNNSGTGTSIVQKNGVQMVQLDVPRCLSITLATGITSSLNVTVYGLDEWGIPLVAQVTVPVSGSTATVNTLSAFMWIQAVKVFASTVANISVGTTDTFGLPYYTANFGNIIPYWAGIKMAVGTTADTVGIKFTTSTTTAILPCIFTPGITVTPTILTGDTRGTIQIPSWPAMVAPFPSDGIKDLLIHMCVEGAGNYDTANPVGSGFQSQNKFGLYGETPYSIPVPTS